MLGALASLAFAIMVVAYIQCRPNTASVVVTGPFDGERAFADLKRIVSFGPRPAGSAALECTRQFNIGEFRAAGVAVAENRFTASTPIGPIPMVNLTATIPGSSPSVVILAGHYDTKRLATTYNERGHSSDARHGSPACGCRRSERIVIRISGVNANDRRLMS